jgi:hypothetical protein
MIKVDFLVGTTIDRAIEELKIKSEVMHEDCCGDFNGKILYSTDSVDDAYMKVIGKTKADFDENLRRQKEEYERQEREHKEKIPELSEEYKKAARGVILESSYDEWDKIVPIRLGDLYRGMELGATLDLCKIMRDEAMSYDERLRKAYDAFMKQGHSGMSAGLVAAMLKKFCPNGEDLADAVMNFRFK